MSEPEPMSLSRSKKSLLAAPPRVINVGLETLAEELQAAGASVVHIQWSPPARGNPRLAGLLAKLGA